MKQLSRILFVTGEVEPFVQASDVASLTRRLPEALHESGRFETRIMMPRYGTISERKNRLHEVIRLCGTQIEMGARTETLKVKVAAIPGIRLQVYFMDNIRFFKRKGLHEDRQGQLYADNNARALFFGRSVLETIRCLQWKPDLVHAFGWISGLLPLLLASEYKDDKLFEDTRIIYTPDGIEPEATLSGQLIEQMNLSCNGDAQGLPVTDIGLKYSDANAFPPSIAPLQNSAIQFSGNTDKMTEQAIALYESTLNGHAA